MKLRCRVASRVFANAARWPAAALAAAFGVALLLATLALPHAFAAGEPQATKSSLPGNSPDDVVWLTDLKAHHVHVGKGRFGKHGETGFRAGPIVVNSVRSPHGLGMHPPNATASYKLDKRYRTFQATAAINDSAQGGSSSPIIFRVELDGKQVWESHDLSEHAAWQPVLLDVTGAKELTLKVGFDQQHFKTGANAHAVWLEPCLRSSPPDPALLKLEDPALYKPSDEVAGYSKQIRDLLKADKFAELEQLAKEARAKRDFLGEFPRLWEFYSALYKPFADSEAGHVEQIDRAADWRAKFPNSVIPRLLAAVNWTGIGVSEDGIVVKPDALAKARDVFEEAKSLDGKDVEFYARFIVLTRWQNGPRQEIDDLLEQAIRIDPTYYPIYQIVATYLFEHGSSPNHEELRTLAESVRDRIGGETGQIAYATVAQRSAIEFGVNVLVRVFPYAELKPAMLALFHRFPTLYPYAVRAAWAAARNDDPATTRELLGPVPDQAWDFHTWHSAATLVGIRRWSAADFPRDQAMRTARPDVGDFPIRLAISADGKTLVAGSDEGRISFIDIATGDLTGSLQVPATIRSMAIDPAGHDIVVSNSASEGPGSLLQLDLNAPDGAAKPLKGHKQRVIDVRFSANGKYLATASVDGTLKIWSPDRSMRSIASPRRDPLWSLDFSPDGSKLCTATTHRTVIVWDPQTGKPLGDPLFDNPKTFDFPLIRFFPDGDHLGYAANDGKLEIWNLKSRTSVSIKTGNSMAFRFAPSPDGKLIAIGRDQGDIDIYDATNLKKIHTFEGHWGEIGDVAFARDGRMLISAASDGTLKFWDMQSAASAALPKSTAKP